MRWIDSQVGNLTCSALALSKRVFGPHDVPKGPYRKIAVMKFFGLGSIVVSSPSVAALREAYPDAEIHYVSFKSNKAILELLNMADKHWYVDISSPSAPKTFTKVDLEDVITTHPITLDSTGRMLYMQDSRKRDTAALVAFELGSGKSRVLVLTSGW